MEWRWCEWTQGQDGRVEYKQEMRAGKDPHNPLKEPALLDIEGLASRTVRQYIFDFLNLAVCGVLLEQLSKLIHCLYFCASTQASSVSYLNCFSHWIYSFSTMKYNQLLLHPPLPLIMLLHLAFLYFFVSIFLAVWNIPNNLGSEVAYFVVISCAF